MEGATWAAFAMAALSLVGNIFSSINARKTARDKLEFDAELREVKHELAGCREQHRQSETDRDELRLKIDASESQIASSKSEIKELRDQLAKMKPERPGDSGVLKTKKGQ